MSATAVFRTPAFAWALWRRHRSALVAVAGLLGVLAVLVVAGGLYQHAAYDRAGLAGCNDTSAECVRLWKPFMREYESWNRAASALLPLFPGVVGAFLGGPLVAREFEVGTYRFAWTQGAGRGRWTAGGLLLVGGALLLLGLGLGWLLRWWNAPLLGLWGGIGPAMFPQGPLAVAGRMLLGFGLGALAGAVLRRTVAAVGAGAAGSAVAAFAAEAVRFGYRAPLTETLHTAVSSGSYQRWVGSVYYTDPSGARIGEDAFYGLAAKPADAEWLLGHGYALHEQYQPESRFWPFQWIEFGWMALVGVAACGLALWWLDRRAA